MPQMPQLRVPRLLVAVIVLGLFALALLAVRQYHHAGDLHALMLAIAASLLCLLTAAGLVYANYETYQPRSNRHLNGSP